MSKTNKLNFCYCKAKFGLPQESPFDCMKRKCKNYRENTQKVLTKKV
jgi:hypothetical protein